MNIKEFIETCMDEIVASALVFAGIAYLFLTHEVQQSLAIITVGAVYLFGKKNGEVST
jgi:hypothetical protein